jgi:cell division protein FtsI/penicillin-binding protein 2
MVAQDRSELSLIKRRMEAAFLIFLLAIMVLALRLGYLQWARARDFARLAERMQGRVFEIDARRGRLEDRNGNPFAIDVLAKAVVINPTAVKAPVATAARIASLLDVSDHGEEILAERIRKGNLKRSRYLKLLRGVERRKAEHLILLASGKQDKDSKPDPLLRGVWLEDTPVRSKPSGLVGIQTIGDVNIDTVGIEGLEAKFDSVLRGRNGQRRVNVDAAGKPVPGSADHTTPPRDGKNIRLTLDRDIQHLVETEIRKVGVAQSADAATAIVMDV